MKPINGYEGLYEISEDGRVFALPRTVVGGRFLKGKYLKLDYNNIGYARVTLCKNRTTKRIFVHRLVAEHFVNNSENKPCINHIDGNKINNHYSNLEWVTVSENTQHAWDNGMIKPRRKTKTA